MTIEEQLRTLIDSAPAHIQRHFAADCAERALRRAKVKDKRLWKAVEVARRYAEGRAGLSELADAKDAAWDASAASAAADASAAARAAAGAVRAAAGAARTAAWADASSAASAASAAARDAWDAAWDAKDAARDTAGAAAESASAASAAAGAAAWDAAWDEEREWQLTHLQCLLAAHNDARSSLLSVLQQRAEGIQKALP